MYHGLQIKNEHRLRRRDEVWRYVKYKEVWIGVKGCKVLRGDGEGVNIGGVNEYHQGVKVETKGEVMEVSMEVSVWEETSWFGINISTCLVIYHNKKYRLFISLTRKIDDVNFL